MSREDSQRLWYRRDEDRIPIFTGKPDDDFHVWLKKFKTMAKARKWDAATQILYIPTYFTGLAENRWHNIPEATVDAFTMKAEPDANDIIQYLTDLFPDLGGSERSIATLYEISQGHRTVGDYVDSFEALLRRAFPKESINANQKKHLFLRGLEKELRKKVEFKNPQSFDEALRWASYLENLNYKTTEVKDQRINTATSLRLQREVPQCFQCGLIGHIQYFCPQIPMSQNNAVPQRTGTYPQRGNVPYCDDGEQFNAVVADGRSKGRKGQGARNRKDDNKRRSLGRPPVVREIIREVFYGNPNEVSKFAIHHNKAEQADDHSKVAMKSEINRVSEHLLSMGEKIGPLSMAKIRIEGVKTVSLFDSGATCSVISEELADKLSRDVKWQTPNTSANSASGHKLNFSKTAILMIEIGVQKQIYHRVHVLTKCPYPCLLGTDFFEKLGSFHIDLKEKFIRLGKDVELELVDQKEFEERRSGRNTVQNAITLLSAETTVLEPWSQTHIWVSAKGAQDDEDFVVDRSHISSYLKENGVLIAKSIGKVQNGRFPITFLNATTKPVSLYKNATVAKANRVSDAANDVINSVHHVPTKDVHQDPLQKLDLTSSDLTSEQKRLLILFLRKQSQVFGAGQINPGQTGKVFHRIDTESQQPIHARAHRIPYAKREKVQGMVKEMVDSGIARPSSSPWSSPIVLIKKKDGDDRFCVDYRALNDITKKDTYPLPKIAELLDSLGKAKFFTTLDLAKGYWQIPMREEDKEKTAFITPDGLYEFNVMPFGLTNAPATFQRMMDVALAGLQTQSCLVYLDDIIIFSETFEDHIRKMQKVFDRLTMFDLKLNVKKCQFARKTVIYLGHSVSKHGIQPNPQTLEVIRKLPVPTSLKALERFMGLASYYRRFVKGFSTIAEPLDALKRKDAKFEWTPNCQEAFEKLKECLMTPPVLAFPNFERPFILETDASGTGIGAILSQEVWDERKRKTVTKPVAYASRSLTKCERNYHATEREALAIIWGLQYFRIYVYGTPVQLISDHAPLQWLMTNKNPSGRLARWAVQLQEYDLVKKYGKVITYKPGKEISHVDACSRMHEINAFVPGDGALQINTEQKKDDYCRKLRARIEAGERLIGFTIEKDILHHWPNMRCRSSEQFPSQIVVPLSLRENILTMCHDNLFGGHMGVNRTEDRISLRYFWPGMRQDCEKWVASCVFCQKRKGPKRDNKEFLTPIPITEPFAKIVVDVLGPLALTENGNRFIVIFTDHFTKYVEAFATPDHTAKTVAKLLVSKVICRHGAPCELLSDQGPEFMSSLVKEVCVLCDVAKINSTAYHPQTQGLTERFNRTLMGILKGYVNTNKTDWDRFIPYALFAYHTSKQKSLGESPFFLMHGRDARMPSDVAFQANRPFYGDLDENLKENVTQKFTLAKELAKQALGKAQETMKTYYDANAQKSVIKSGSFVSLHQPAVPPGISPKLWVHWKGPYRVIELKVPNALIMEEKDGARAFWTHLNRLKPFIVRYEGNRVDNGMKQEGKKRNHNQMANKNPTIVPEHVENFGHRLRSGKMYQNPVHSLFLAPHPHRATRIYTNSYASDHRLGTKRR